MRVLIVDEDGETTAALRALLGEAGVTVESADDTFAAMEKLRVGSYCAVILDPAIHRRLNGFAVLNFLELEQPETLDNVYLLTGMSEQTIRRTAPSVLPRLFRKPSALHAIAATVVGACLRRVIIQRSHDRFAAVEPGGELPV
ncbi:MAG TPA: response regulator [Thermoanaerobaculia bacterium]|nr:response regulator [Thermoanaerobaculia bacterium]